MEKEIWSEFPKSWVKVCLDEISELCNGINFKKDQKGKEGILTIDVLNMYSNSIYIDFRSLYRVDKKVTAERLLKYGDILFVRSSVKREGVGWATAFKESINEPVTFCGFIIRARLKSKELLPEYFTYYLRSDNTRKIIIGSSSQVTITNINQNALGKLSLPLPPFPEQHRIVAKIEELFSELDNGIENLKKARKQLKTYRQAVLKYAFEGKLTEEWRTRQREAGNPPEPAEKLLKQIKTEREKHCQKQLEDWEKACQQAKAEGKKKPAKPKKPKELPPLTEKELAELPQGWDWVMVNEISEVISGQHILKDDYNENKEGIAYLTGPADFDLIYPKITKWTTNPKAIAVQNNILITVKGAGVGKTNILDVKKAAISRQLMSVNLIKGDHNFVFRFFQFNFNKFQKLGLGSTVPGIDRNAILSFVIPFCSMLEQNIIVQEIESRLSVCDKIEQTVEDSLKKAEALRQSILKKAFAGELTRDWREKHPELISGENSAEKLLERIKAEKALSAADRKKPQSKKTKKK